MITGYWRGKINRQKVEVKIVQKGDRVTGTSYYYESPTHFRKYSIRGYFDPNTNALVWWDDQLLEEKTGRISINTPGKIPLLSRADFNCPGEGKMILEGKSARKDEDDKITGDVRLDKTDDPQFHDEWDDVIDNYLVGGNDPELIDEIEKGMIAVRNDEPVIKGENPVPATDQTEKKLAAVNPVVTKSTDNLPGPVISPQPQTIIEKFTTREKKLIREIPLSGDSVELRFYDNAEIDGDSISLFLNNHLFRENIRLTGSAYIIKLAVSEMRDTNELIMVAENLGSIPPNTSYMVVIVGDKRYDAYLASTEGSSAMVRFIKQ